MGNGNEEKKPGDQRCNANDAQKNLLIDLSNDAKPTGNSWVSDKTRMHLMRRYKSGSKQRYVGKTFLRSSKWLR